MEFSETTLRVIEGFFDLLKQHQVDFIFLTFIICFTFAAILLIPAYRKNFSESINYWAKPLGWTFIILGLIYLVRLFYWKYLFFYETTTLHNFYYFKITSKNLPSILTDVLSGCSNFFLLISAFNLQINTKENKLIVRGFLEKRWGKLVLVLIVISVIIAVYSRLAQNPHDYLKLLDNSISSLVFIGFGLTLFRQLSFRRSHVFASTALISSFLYGFTYFFRILQNIGGSHFNILGNLWVYESESNAFIVVFSLVLKAGLFFPSYYLITINSTNLNGIKELLQTVAIDRREFLESNGILKKINEILKADEVNLYIKLPGKKRNLVSSYKYPPSNRYLDDPYKRPDIIEGEFNGNPTAAYKQAFNENRTILYSVSSFKNNLEVGEGLSFFEKDSIIIEPIRYQGAVIGCLEARLNMKRFKFHFAKTDVQQVQAIAVMLTRILQANREIAGLDQLITSLGSLQIDIQLSSFDEIIVKILEILDDLFNPLVIGLHTNVGFKSHLRSFISKERRNEFQDKEIKEKLESKLLEGHPQQQIDFECMVSYIKNDLVVPSKIESVGAKERKFGQFIVAIPTKNDKPNTPTLFTYHLFCRLIANIISDAYLDFGRDYFNRHVKELTINLNSTDNSNLSTWFKIVEKKVLEVDLLWAVISKEEVFDEFIGSNKEIIWDLVKNENPDFQSEIIDVYSLKKKSKHGTNHVIKLKMKEYKGHLWLGVERDEFGSEVIMFENSPWKIFLERLAEISDTSLSRIIEKEKKEQMAKEAAEFHGLATAAVTTGTLLHQIGNQVKELTFPIDNLKRSLSLGTLRGEKESWDKVYKLSESASKLGELTKLLSGIVKVESHRPCKIGEIINESKKLFEEPLEQYKIKFENTLTKELLEKEVDVPFYVGSFALTNLVINAKDEIKIHKILNGVIKVEAEENENSILFHVIDNGCGIPLRIKNKIFEKGFTTKSTEISVATGLGLYLTHKSLKENGALLELTSSGPEPPTTFTMIFPKVKRS